MATNRPLEGVAFFGPFVLGQGPHRHGLVYVLHSHAGDILGPPAALPDGDQHKAKLAVYLASMPLMPLISPESIRAISSSGSFSSAWHSGESSLRLLASSRSGTHSWTEPSSPLKNLLALNALLFYFLFSTLYFGLASVAEWSGDVCRLVTVA